MADLTVISRARDVYVATHANVLLVDFREATPATCVRAWEEGMRAIAKSGQKAVYFALVEVQSIPPDDKARQACARFFEEHRDDLAGFVLAFQAPGFRGAMVRTVVSGILTALPRFRLGFPRHIVQSLEEAAEAARTCSPGIDRLALIDAFETLRRSPPA